MSVLLPSHGIPDAETSETRQACNMAQDKLAAEKASPTMLVFAWIWTGLIAYLAFRAVLD